MKASSTEDQEKKEDNWLNPMTKIVDRPRSVSWGNDSQPTGVVKPVYGIPTFPLTLKAVQSKGHIF